MPQQLEVALHLMLGLQRMRHREAGRARDLFVEARVVFHRARAERVQARVDRHVQLRQPGEVPDHVDLGHLDFVRDLFAPQRRRQERVERLLRHIERGKLIAAATRLRALEDERLGRVFRGRDFLFENRGHCVFLM